MNVLVFLLIWNFVQSDEMNYIPSDWVDPTDMRHYDRYNKRMRTQVSDTKETCPASINAASNNSNAEDLERFEIFVERFVNHLLSAANLKDKVMTPKTRITTEISVLISAEELSQLKQLSEGIKSKKLNELDALFSSILTTERGFSFDSMTPYLNPVQLLVHNMSYEKMTVVIFMMVVCVVLWMFAVGRELKKIIIFLYLIFFMGGLAWNWWKMYQEAVIEQYTEMQRLSQVPDICIPKRSGFFSFIFSSSDNEDCRKYHTSFQFNPFSKVPPTIVLSETVSGMMIHPLKALGSSIGEFLAGVNDAASWPLKIIFLPFIVIVSTAALLCLVIVSLGVKLNVWTLLGGVSIGGKIANETAGHRTAIDETSLKQTIEFERDDAYVLTQVGAIKKYVTSVQNKVPIQAPSVSKLSENSAVHQYFVPPSISNRNEFYPQFRLASGDNQSCRNFNDIKDPLADYFKNLSRLLKNNSKEKLPPIESMTRRSFVIKKKYK